MKKQSSPSGIPAEALGLPKGKKAETPRIRITNYNARSFEEKDAKTVEEAQLSAREPQTISWINVGGLHDAAAVEKIGTHFGLHPLIQEDILSTAQRPKMEDMGEYLFLVMKMFNPDGGQDEDRIEQMSLVLGPNFVLSFQEEEGHVFDSVRERIRKENSRLRRASADFLAYALIDAIVDSYFEILEDLGERIEDAEEELVEGTGPQTLNKIHCLKKEMIFLRKSVWPLREVISGLERSESPLIAKTTKIFLRDVYDHIIQVIDTVETYRDMLSGMLDMYLSSVSNRMNEIMKVLTVIATIFIPLTFIVGLYGMNFKFMPELNWRWGYFAILGLMAAVAVWMIFYFKRRKWL